MWKLLCSKLWSRQPLTDSYLSDCECNNSTNNLSSGAAELALNPLPLTLSLKYTPPHWTRFLSLSLSLLLFHSLSSGEENIWAIQCWWKSTLYCTKCGFHYRKVTVSCDFRLNKITLILNKVVLLQQRTARFGPRHC